MTREVALFQALQMLNENIDLAFSTAEERRSVLSLSLSGSPGRIAFIQEFVQCFDAHEDFFLDATQASKISSVPYWYCLARTNSELACHSLPKFTEFWAGSPNVLWYVVGYALRQGQI